MQREHQFRPGDRVLVEAEVRKAHPGVGIAVAVAGIGGAVCVSMAPFAAIHPLPTPAQKLRDAAEVLEKNGWHDAPGYILRRIREKADELEAAAAPKPPSLREAVRAYFALGSVSQEKYEAAKRDVLAALAAEPGESA